LISSFAKPIDCLCFIQWNTTLANTIHQAEVVLGFGIALIGSLAEPRQ
jgi:hypothetical protein